VYLPSGERNGKVLGRIAFFTGVQSKKGGLWKKKKIRGGGNSDGGGGDLAAGSPRSWGIVWWLLRITLGTVYRTKRKKSKEKANFLEGGQD